MCECATAVGSGVGFRFWQDDVNLGVQFDGGTVTSDGGLPWIVEAEAALGVCTALAAQVPEWRRGGVRHSLERLVRQRVFQIACGYEDQNDADRLRRTRRSSWPVGACRSASRTWRVSRRSPGWRTRSIGMPSRGLPRRSWTCTSESVAALACLPRILLDLDGTDDPAHGEQEGVAYHGYYRQHMYHPLLVFDGDTGQLITAVLRPGDVHGSRFVVLVLRRLLRKLRAAWPDVPVELRADSGFAIPRLYAWCEANAVAYTIGLIPNPRLERLAAPLLEQARAQSVEQGGAKVRLAGETRYQADSWPHARRVVFKAEILLKGPNTRFVVTTRTDDPLAVYDHYVDRGDPENWIKDLKNALRADRLSDHRFWANAFRLLLHAAAYWLLDQLRRWLLAAQAARLQLDTLRLRLIKIGGWVRESTRFTIPDVCVHLSSHHPGLVLWFLLARARRIHVWRW